MEVVGEINIFLDFVFAYSTQSENVIDEPFPPNNCIRARCEELLLDMNHQYDYESNGHLIPHYYAMGLHIMFAVELKIIFV